MVKKFKIGHIYRYGHPDNSFFTFKAKKIDKNNLVVCEMIRQKGFPGWENGKTIPITTGTIGPSCEEIFKPKTITRFTSKNELS